RGFSPQVRRPEPDHLARCDSKPEIRLFFLGRTRSRRPVWHEGEPVPLALATREYPVWPALLTDRIGTAPSPRSPRRLVWPAQYGRLPVRFDKRDSSSSASTIRIF